MTTPYPRLPVLLALIVVFAFSTANSFAEKLHQPPRKSIQRIIPAQHPARTPIFGTLDELYWSTDTPLDIPDGPGGVVTSSITIHDSTVTIDDLNIRVDITHTWVRDLTLTLIRIADAETTEVTLLDRFPGDAAENMTGTWFNDEASFWILEAQPPFTGDYKPMDFLSVFRDQSLQATWILEIRDNFVADIGTLNSWAIETGHVDVFTGTVTQAETGDSVRHIKVEILDSTVAGNLALTGNDGTFTFPRLDAGTYSLQFTHPYFDSLTVENVTVPGSADAAMTSEFRYFHTQFRGEPLDIVDAQTLEITLPIENTSFEVVDAVLTVNLYHTYMGDLDLRLVSDNETEILLVEFFSGYTGENMIGCRFDGHAGRSIIEALAPFSGNWRSEDSMRTFGGETTSGNWSLLIQDEATGDQGSVFGVELTLIHEPVTTGTIAGMVTDPDTDAIVGASVTVDTGEEILTACTGQAGEYALSGVPEGPQIDVVYDHELYLPSTQQVSVTIGETTTQDAQLTPEARLTVTAPRSDTLSIPDLGSVRDSLTVSRGLDIFDLDVEVQIDHSYVGDLAIWLEFSSSDTLDTSVRVQLADFNLEFVGPESVVWRFDQESCDLWTENEDRGSGVWQPFESLDAFNGINSSEGQWYLDVLDNAAEDTGTLTGWTLYFYGESQEQASGNPPVAIPGQLTFHGAYPNPFNASTTFRFELGRAGLVELRLFNVLGQQSATILNESFDAGLHRVNFDAAGLASGIYFARLTALNQVQTRKIVLLK